MSGSEDSDDFLSADSHEGDTNADSSSVTLSSDSEDECGNPPAAKCASGRSKRASAGTGGKYHERKHGPSETVDGTKDQCAEESGGLSVKDTSSSEVQLGQSDKIVGSSDKQSHAFEECSGFSEKQKRIAAEQCDADTRISSEPHSGDSMNCEQRNAASSTVTPDQNVAHTDDPKPLPDEPQQAAISTSCSTLLKSTSRSETDEIGAEECWNAWEDDEVDLERQLASVHVKDREKERGKTGESGGVPSDGADNTDQHRASTCTNSKKSVLPTDSSFEFVSVDEECAEDKSTRGKQQKEAWGEWDSWGCSLLSSARGVSRSVMGGVEASLGAPDPEQLARQITQPSISCQQQSPHHSHQPSESPCGDVSERGGISSWLGGVSSLVVSTGLDTLEMIGKKTMHALNDEQLGLRNTVRQLTNKPPTLSQTLRERHGTSADLAVVDLGSAHSGVCSSELNEGRDPVVTFNTLFESSDGSAHMDALSMLSVQCRDRVCHWRRRNNTTTTTSTSSSSDHHLDARQALDTLHELCCAEVLPALTMNVDNFDDELRFIVSGFKIPLKPSRLSIAHSSLVGCLDSLTSSLSSGTMYVNRRSVDQVRRKLCVCLVQLAAGLAEFCHKLAEIWLTDTAPGGGIMGVSGGRVAVGGLVQLAALTAADAETVTTRLVQVIARHATNDATTDTPPLAALTTDIFLEANYCRQCCVGLLHEMSAVVQAHFIVDPLNARA